MADTPPPLIGAQLGSAILTKLIGSGGMGMVYLAHQPQLERDVAIKVLRSGLGVRSEQNEEFLERFRREAHVIAQLDHIHILPIYEYGEQDGLAYLVMPYLTGGSLYERLRRGSPGAAASPLALSETLLYVEQAASALHYAHAHKIVHRDIKPRNMLFHADGRLLLVDFGIAHILRDGREKATGHTLTGSGNFIGSVEYMAPEMVRGRAVDPRTDVYELGVVLFQMLTGHLPFTGATPFVIAAQHLHEPVPSLLEFKPTLTSSLDTVVRTAMAKNPDERFTSPVALAQALRSALASSIGSVGAGSLSTDLDSSIDMGLTLPPSLGEVTQKINTSEMPTAHQELSAADLARQTSQLTHQSRTTSAAFSGSVGLSVSDAGEGEQFTERPGKRKRLLSFLVLLCFCLLLFTVGLFLSPDLLSRAHIALPFLATTQATAPPTPAPGPTSTPNPTPTPTSPPTLLAQQIVRAYYNDINQQRYQDAYNLWGSSYQSMYSFATFSQGFLTTQHDDIVFQGSSLLPDGTVQVNLILYATDKHDAGSSISAYQGAYIIGQESGRWKLMTSNLAPVAVPSPMATEA